MFESSDATLQRQIAGWMKMRSQTGTEERRKKKEDDKKEYQVTTKSATATFGN